MAVRKGVGRAAHLDVRLEDDGRFAVLGTHGAAREAAHAAPNDDDVVLAFVSAKAVARALVDGLRVLPFALRVVGEGHHFISRRLLRLRDIFGGGV